MDLFGSREEDPLLENDPLAPSPDENADSGEEPTADDAPSSSNDDDSPSGDAPSSSNASNGSSPHFALAGTGDTRTLRRSVEKTEDGGLSVLNAAFDQGWRLDRIEYRAETDDLLFTLRREDSEPRDQDLIV